MLCEILGPAGPGNREVIGLSAKKGSMVDRKGLANSLYFMHWMIAARGDLP